MNTPSKRQQVIADALKRRRVELKMSQTDVAKAVSQLLGGETFSQQSYASIESGRTRHSKYLPQIARALGIPIQAVDPTAPPPSIMKDVTISTGSTATVVSTASRKLPVLGSIAAGVWCEMQEQFTPETAEDWIDAPGPVGPDAFVLRIDGVSMHNPGGHVSFADGDRVIIDPDAPTEPGDFVVAKLAGSSHVTFKRLQREGAEFFLEAINPDWDPRYIRVTEEWHILGKAVWKVQKL